MLLVDFGKDDTLVFDNWLLLWWKLIARSFSFLDFLVALIVDFFAITLFLVLLLVKVHAYIVFGGWSNPLRLRIHLTIVFVVVKVLVSLSDLLGRLLTVLCV